MYVSQETLIFLHPKTWNLTGKPLYPSVTFTKKRFFQWKNSFFGFVQHWCKTIYFKNYPALITKIIEIVFGKWNGHFIVEFTLLGMDHIVKSRLWNEYGNEFHIPLRSKVNFELSSNNKDQPRELTFSFCKWSSYLS